MSNSVRIDCAISSVELLLRGIAEIGLSLRDLRAAKQELKELENCQGEKIAVDYVIKNEVGDQIGIKTNADGKVELITQSDTPSVKATVDKVTQAYARLKILDEVKRKGYQKVKEEKLANGSIRLVVEKWR